jgi:aspartate 1-decarboxylase
MHAKLHRVTVTEANVNYVGSITIDRDLLDRVGLLPLEEVDIVNLNNGKQGVVVFVLTVVRRCCVNREIC